MSKDLKTTLIITISLFSFIIFLLYLLYCFAYYDKNQEDIFYNRFIDNDTSFIYDNMADKDGLSKKQFEKVLSLMYDKKTLKDIYYLYYRNIEDFEYEELLEKYYYGDYKIEKEDITYSVNSKTNLFKRRAIFYKNISLINKKGYKSSLGVKRNVSLLVEENTELKIDNELIECDNDICKVSKIFGGIHEINYVSNGYEYYGLVNIVNDNQNIEVTNLDNLVRINFVNSNDIFVNKDNENIELKIGKYNLSKCYLSFGCPSNKKSYIQLNEDGTCQFYTYISLDKAGDLYNGTYIKDGEFLAMHFDGHSYQVFDYDTKESTNIVADVDIEMRYKILNNSLISDSYKFVYSGNDG
ncbi:MAG: hypothetical protein ACI4XM_08805 [Candidatus Coprovivens sp.]